METQRSSQEFRLELGSRSLQCHTVGAAQRCSEVLLGAKQDIVGETTRTVGGNHSLVEVTGCKKASEPGTQIRRRCQTQHEPDKGTRDLWAGKPPHLNIPGGGRGSRRIQLGHSLCLFSILIPARTQPLFLLHSDVSSRGLRLQHLELEMKQRDKFAEVGAVNGALRPSLCCWGRPSWQGRSPVLTPGRAPPDRACPRSLTLGCLTAQPGSVATLWPWWHSLARQGTPVRQGWCSTGTSQIPDFVSAPSPPVQC